MEDQTFEDEGELEETDTNEELESETNDTDTLDEDGKPKNSDFLAKAKEITGREFKDEDDFKKHYKNLSSFVGKKIEPKEPKEQKQVKTSSGKMEELEFKVEHPELKDNFDVIEMVSKAKGISYNEAISDTMVKELLDVRQGKKGESVIHSNNKISSDKTSSTKLKQNAQSVEGAAAFIESMMEE